MIRLIQAELFKLRKRALTGILLIIMAAVLIVMHLILFAVSRTIPADVSGGPGLRSVLGLPAALPFALSILAALGSVLSVILMASSMGSEYTWRTMRTFLTVSESRASLLTAKLASVLILVIAGLVIGIVIGIIMSLITSMIGRYTIDPSFVNFDYLRIQFFRFWRTVYIILPYVSIAFLLSILGRSTVPGIAAGIGLPFLEPFAVGLMTLAGGWVAEIPKFLPAANVATLQTMDAIPGGFSGGLGFNMGGDAVGPLHATLVLGAYSAVCIAVSFWLFRKRDVTS
jgi:ABC-type transport system involved in multi-copper enzyme maturation permease subunit